MKLGQRKTAGSAFSFDMFTPKRIIFNAVKQRLEGTGIVKIILVFNVTDDKYNVMLANETGGAMQLKIEQDDITTIKKLFVTKIEKRYRQEHDKEIKAIILHIDMKIEDYKIYIQDMNDNVEFFNFNL